MRIYLKHCIRIVECHHDLAEMCALGEFLHGLHQLADIERLDMVDWFDHAATGEVSNLLHESKTKSVSK